MKNLIYLLLLASFISCKKSEVGQMDPESFPTDSVVYFRDNPSGGIYVINKTRANHLQLALTATNPLVITSPNWGPNGKIYFVAKFEADSLMQVYSMNVDGSAVARLTDEQNVTHDQLSVSPISKKALFFKINTPTAGMYTINLDGTNEQRISDYVINPSWHPDGNRIIYVESFDANPNGQMISNIFIMNYDGSGKTRITHNTDVYKHYFYPFISPDGTKIAFTEFTTDTNNDTYLYSNIYSMNIDGTNEQKILVGNASNNWSNCNWSKDGKWLLISDANLNLLLLKADGSTQRQISSSGSQAAMLKNF